MNVGILANPHKPGSIPTIQALRSALSARGISSVLDEGTAKLVGEGGGIPADAFASCVDIAVVLGGDGTVLHAVSRLGVFEKPVAGINIGTLGFLTSCTDDEIDGFAEALSENRFSTSARTMLEVVLYRSGKPPLTFTALNEVTLARGDTGRMISIVARVNGELLNRYRADGLLVATPTGSTAYSLSAGGPLIAPCAAVFLITPICPHSLSQRALALSDSCVVELSSDDRETAPMIFTVDGRDNMAIEPGDRIEVRKSKRVFHLLRLGERSFYEALRQKLGWQGI